MALCRIFERNTFKITFYRFIRFLSKEPTCLVYLLLGSNIDYLHNICNTCDLSIKYNI